jgi:hypothetical protein
VVGLVDFVLHDIWGMNRSASATGLAPRPAAAAKNTSAPAGQASPGARLPGGRGHSR